MFKDPHFRNVIFLSSSFWFVWLAFFSQSLIEEAVINEYSENGNINKHAGYISLAICFAVETICDSLGATLVNSIGPKWSMILGALSSAVFTSSFLYLNEYVLYATSALFGVGCAAIWVGQGNYLAMNSNEKTAAKHSGIFFAFFKSGLIMAGILLLGVTKISDKSGELSYASIKILYGVFTVVALIGAVLFAFLPMPKDTRTIEDQKPKLTIKEMLKSTLKVFLMKDMILISITTSYIGFQWSFWLSIFPTCVAFTQSLGSDSDKPVMLALCVIFEGIGQAGAGLACIYMSSRFPRLRPRIFTTFAIFLHLSMFGLVFLMFPKESSLDKTWEEGFIEPIVPLTYLIPFLLGVGDVMLKSPMYSLIIRKLPDQSAEAFALFNFYQSLTCSMAFFYSTAINLYWQLGILVVAAIIGGICVLIVDRSPEKAETMHVIEFSTESRLNNKSYMDLDNVS